MSKINQKRKKLFEQFVSYKIGLSDYTAEQIFNRIIELGKKIGGMEVFEELDSHKGMEFWANYITIRRRYLGEKKWESK